MNNYNDAAHGHLFVVSGPSGVGKTTLVDMALKEQSESLPIYKVITYTTREPRAGEVSGVDYHFISKGDFEQKIKEGFFLEWGLWGDSYYGSSREVIDNIKTGKSYIMILDREGMQKVSKIYPDLVSLWIMVPNIDILRQRLYKRGTESAEKIEKRLEIAKKELNLEEEGQLYDYHVKNLYLKDSFSFFMEVLKGGIADKNNKFQEI